MGRGKRDRGKKSKSGCRDNDSTEMFIKIKAKFKCSSESCNNVWTSVHGWVREACILCEACGIKAKLVDVVDEQLGVDFYSCPGENCGYNWETIHDNNGVVNERQECVECGAFAFHQGTQFLFGRHYWFICPNANCEHPEGRNWDDFYFEKLHSQRCGLCYSRGDIIKKNELKPPPFWLWKKKKADNGDNNGVSTHNSALCDMCCDVIGKGFPGNCRNYRKATYERGVGPGGGTTLTIISAK